MTFARYLFETVAMLFVASAVACFIVGIAFDATVGLAGVSFGLVGFFVLMVGDHVADLGMWP